MRFLLVDRIDALEPGRRIDARKTVSFEEAWLPRPNAPFPAIPSALLVEAILQAGMWLLRHATDFRRQPVVVAAEDVRVGRPVRAGETIRLVAEVRRLSDEGGVLRGEARAGDEVVASGGRIVCAFLPLDEFDDPDEARLAFREMQEPKHRRAAGR
jgi:3-hydroxyacyl-[acyl-carrier-protein] dehydratase